MYEGVVGSGGGGDHGQRQELAGVVLGQMLSKTGSQLRHYLKQNRDVQTVIEVGDRIPNDSNQKWCGCRFCHEHGLCGRYRFFPGTAGDAAGHTVDQLGSPALGSTTPVHSGVAVPFCRVGYDS